MSAFILENIAPFVMHHLNANIEKITRVIGVFNKLCFPDGFFDFVVFDAALHYIPLRVFGRVMNEVKRVLKPGGEVIAIREPILPKIPFYAEHKRNLFGLHEKKYGVTENIFTKDEWKRMFEETGFEPEFIPNKIILGNSIIKKLFRNTPLKLFYPLLSPQFFIRLVQK